MKRKFETIKGNDYTVNTKYKSYILVIFSIFLNNPFFSSNFSKKKIEKYEAFVIFVNIQSCILTIIH